MLDQYLKAGEKTRKFTKELLDISRNVVLLGGIKYFADKLNSYLLIGVFYFLNGVLTAYIFSYFQVRVGGEALRSRLRLPKWFAISLVAFAGLVVFSLMNFLIDATIKEIASAQTRQ